MKRYRVLLVGLVMCLCAADQLRAGGLIGGPKKVSVNRMLPPVVELDARSFGIDASSQDREADAIAASFKESFRAKIQGDDRFVYSATNPVLRISIIITRYYVEPKHMTSPDGKVSCTTHTGSLKGTFQVVELSTGRPLASDTIGWMLQTGRTKHWLTSIDGDEVNIKGPNEKFTIGDSFRSFVPDAVSPGGLLKLGRRAPHPCDLPLTQNEARDVLADAFLTQIMQMAVPYGLAIEVPIFSNKAIARAVEDAIAGEWSKALDGALALKPLSDAGDEGQRLYLIGLAHEALGYQDGQRAFEVNKRIQSKLPPDELAKQQTELRRIVDLAKERFDTASLSFADANKKQAEEEYRQGERRADQSRRLYARIQKYRDLKSEPVVDTAAVLRMPDVLAMCAQGVDETIIIYRIERATQVAITEHEYGELAQCGPRQKVLFQALVKRRGDGKAPVVLQTPPAGTKPVTPKAKPKTTQPAKPATGTSGGSSPSAGI